MKSYHHVSFSGFKLSFAHGKYYTGIENGEGQGIYSPASLPDNFHELSDPYVPTVLSGSLS